MSKYIYLKYIYITYCGNLHWIELNNKWINTIWNKWSEKKKKNHTHTQEEEDDEEKKPKLRKTNYIKYYISYDM